jgi:transcriptional regulator with XRE-family HTH domain
MIEMGRRKRGPSLDVAVRIATALGTELPDLFGGFRGLTPESIDAARVIEDLPPQARAALVAFLRTNASEKKRK